MAESAILIPTFHRNSQLLWNLKSIARQPPVDAEILVLDDSWKPDSDCEELVASFQNELDISYLHTGKQKTANYWRVPGFALNVGAKRTGGDFIFLCCAEIYHHNNTIQPMVDLLREHKEKVMIIPIGKTDRNGAITAILNQNGELSDDQYNNFGTRLLVQYPFFMGLPRKDFFDIGGYDEDFIGVSAEDKDLVERLKWRGGKHIQSSSKIVHLAHSRVRAQDGLQQDVRVRTQYNRSLYQSKKWQVVRNVDREWGAL